MAKLLMILTYSSIGRKDQGGRQTEQKLTHLLFLYEYPLLGQCHQVQPD